MKNLFLGLKRTLRPGMMLMLAVLILCVAGANRAGEALSLRPCGIVCEDDSETARQILEALEAKGFVPCDDRAALEAGIAGGTLDCGAVLLPGLGSAVERNKLDRQVLILTAPMSFLPDLYQAHIQSTLFAASAPARTIQAAEKTGVALDREEVEAELRRYYEEGYCFTFTLETVEGGVPATQKTGEALPRAAAAILLLAILLPGMAGAVQDTRRMGKRIGRPAAFRHILLPMAFWCTLLSWGGACLGMGGGYAAALMGYCLLLAGLGLLAALLPVRQDALLPGLLLGSLALYPIYFDLAELWPGFALLRLAFPPCWLPTLLAHPVVSLAAGGGLTALALLLVGTGGTHDRI
ncbi:MAG: hypothetical protein ACI3VZ_07935 [Faecousia sp.]